MPLTQPYVDQLKALSDSIEKALNDLRQESLEVFVGDEAILKNGRLGLLLKNAGDNPSIKEQNELLGTNANEHGARQRRFLLEHIWNEIIKIHNDIHDNKLHQHKQVEARIAQVSQSLNKAVVPLAKDLFSEHPLTERKVNFVTNLVQTASRLLQKQCAVQALLATNESREIPSHTESLELIQSRSTYLAAVKKHHESFSVSVTENEKALKDLEGTFHRIEIIRNALLLKKSSLSTQNTDILRCEKSLSDQQDELTALLAQEPGSTATTESLEALDSRLSAAAEMLIREMRSYNESVHNKIKQDTENTSPFIDAQVKALNELELTASQTVPSIPLDEGNLKKSLVELASQHASLQEASIQETLKLEAYSAALTALRSQLENDTRKIREAHKIQSLVLSDTAGDTTTLSSFETACTEQEDTYATFKKLMPGGSSPWTTLKLSTEKNFNAINKQHQHGNGLLQHNSADACIDAQIMTQVAEMITTTNQKLRKLADQIAETKDQHQRLQNVEKSFSRVILRVRERIQKSVSECDDILSELHEHNNQRLIAEHRRKIEAANQQLRLVNEKRRRLVEKIQTLQPHQSEADYLRQRLTDLQGKFNDHSFSIAQELHPDTLLQELAALPISLELTVKHDTGIEKLDAVINQNPLTTLRKKVEKLDKKIAHANQSYHYRRKGTLIGTLTGGGLALLLCGGIAASIYFSFGLAIPMLIGIGIAAAISPSIGASIGRFFGWRKDKTSFNQAQLSANQVKADAFSRIHSNRNEGTLLRQKSMRSQEPLDEQTDLDALLAKTNRKVTYTRAKTVILPSLNAYSINFTSIANINPSPVQSDSSSNNDDDLDEVAPSFSTDKTVADPSPTLVHKSVHFNEEKRDSSSTSNEDKKASSSTAFEEQQDNPSHEPVAASSRAATPTTEPTYSLSKGGQFKHFTLSFAQRPAPQKVQREASEPVVVKAYGPG